MQQIELTEVDNGLGMIFPDDLLSRLQVRLGDVVHLTETDAGFTLHSDQNKEPVHFLIHRGAVAPNCQNKK